MNSHQYAVLPGRATPLGPSIVTCAAGTATVNFAVHTTAPQQLYLCLFPPLAIASSDHSRIARDLLFPPIHFSGRTGAVRHVQVAGVDPACAYALWLDCAPRLLLDPCARFIEAPSARHWGVCEGEEAGEGSPAERVEAYLASFATLKELGIRFPLRLGLVAPPPATAEFDWGDDAPPGVALEDVVVYEANVRGLTAGLSVEETGGYLPGTFAAAVARLDYLKALGVTTLELLPVSEFNEVEMSPLDELEQLRGDEDLGRVRRVNVWGYVPLQAAAFAVMGRYGETVGSASYELKLLVRELHRRGMECVLDVVYNHVAGASCSLHFLDAEKEYFIVDENRNHSNISGCGNTTSPNAPCMTALVLESLRWLVTEYRVDGFRIDAAGVLAREVDGKPGGKGPFALLQAIAGDPVLSRRVKFIVEPWDAGDGVGSPNYLNGNYPLRTALEWNPDFGRAMRWFVFRGGDAEKGKEFARGFCKALRGSQRMYGSRPYGSAHSVNYLSCHDGFSLADSASYAKQTNVDGYADPTVCCHGAEGPTDDAEIVELRSRQLRNLVLASALARGIPMISQGCEGGISKGGNNNCYDVDGPPNWLSSDFETTPLTSFVRQALSFRRSRKELRGLDFYDDLQWRTRSGGVRNRPDSRSNHRKNAHPSRETGHGFVAWTVGDLYVAFNASSREVKAVLPSLSAAGVATETRLWRKVCDTFERAGDLYFRDVPSGVASRRENIVEEVSNPDEGTPSICIEANSAVVYEWN